MKSSTETTTAKTVASLMTGATGTWTPTAQTSTYNVTKKGVTTSALTEKVIAGKTAKEHDEDAKMYSGLAGRSRFLRDVAGLVYDLRESAVMNMVNNPKQNVPGYRLNKEDKVEFNLHQNKAKLLKDMIAVLKYCDGINFDDVKPEDVKGLKTPLFNLGTKNIGLYTCKDLVTFGYDVFNKTGLITAVRNAISKKDKANREAFIAEKYGNLNAVKAEIRKSIKALEKSLATAKVA